MTTCRFNKRHAGDGFCIQPLPVRKRRHGHCADGHDTADMPDVKLHYEACTGDLYCEECPENWG